MLAKILSSAVSGVEGLVIEVEVDLAKGLPAFSTVGLPEVAVREAKDRVKAAIKNSGYDFPLRRITVNLAPASVKKVGTGYDLPIALGILNASDVLQTKMLEATAVVGELSLDGSVRPVPGVLSMVIAAKLAKIKRFLVPSANGAEAAVVPDITIVPIDRLDQAVEYLAGRKDIEPVTVDSNTLFNQNQNYGVDFADVKGQDHVKRALEVAACGGHNLLLSGIPGTGKTMMARRVPTILPKMTMVEAMETTKVYSTIGMLPEALPLMVTRPFRTPHHTISDAGLIGGGQLPRPGEVSLAHNGVLFLDELPEFRKNVLEVLRQPLEDGEVTIARAATSMNFPARIMLVAAMNPCPCGYLGDNVRECTCTPVQIQRYRGRLSGPLLDRIDMHVDVPAVKVKELTALSNGESSASIQKRVEQARQKQRERFKDLAGVHCNAQMRTADIKKYCPVDNPTADMLNQAITRLGLSARAYHRILKIALTIADLEGAAAPSMPHIAEAIQYRRIQFEL